MPLTFKTPTVINGTLKIRPTSLTIPVNSQRSFVITRSDPKATVTVTVGATSLGDLVFSSPPLPSPPPPEARITLDTYYVTNHSAPFAGIVYRSGSAGTLAVRLIGPSYDSPVAKDNGNKSQFNYKTQINSIGNNDCVADWFLVLLRDGIEVARIDAATRQTGRPCQGER
jgi:hypothetical protein